MEGPQFSTRAESELHRSWGASLIGMTAMPEAKLAREAELCYALVALPTDYDCWRPHPAHVDQRRGGGHPQPQQRDQALPAGQHLRVLAVLGQGRDGFVHSGRTDVVEARRDHCALPSVCAPS